jgi:hypothetical protein
MNKDIDVLNRSVTDSILTSVSAGLAAGLLSWLFLPNSTLDIFGYQTNSMVFTGLSVSGGSFLGQMLAQKTVPKLKLWWPSWSEDTRKSIGDLIPTVFSGVSALGVGSILAMQVPSVNGAISLVSIGSISYMGSEMVLNKALYNFPTDTYDYV